jgi:serine/threonine protein kinase
MSTTPTVSVIGATAAPSGTPRALEVPRQLGPVTLLREIGRGAMGAVWLGRHELLGRDVAVKFLLDYATDSSEAASREFLDGARAAAAVRHLGVTAILHADLVESCPYIVMEYIDGPTLAQIIRTTGAMDAPAATAVVKNVAEAVAALHEQGIVHRDIKPANVLVDRGGRTYVTDFGLTCLRTRGGVRVGGTPAYMAPEAFQGSFSPRSDVYALGVVIFELLTNSFPNDPMMEMLRDMYDASCTCAQRLKRRGIDAACIELIERALHHNPIYRFKTAEHLARALGDLECTSRDAPGMLVSLVARTRQTGAQAAPARPADAGSDYYHELSQLAAHRQTSRSSIAAESVSAAGESVAPPADPTGRLRVSWPCAGCGYDLRWQHRDGPCPECGRAVNDSFADDLLVFADVPWLKRTAREAALCLVGLLMLVGCWLAVPVTASMVRSWWHAEAVGLTGIVLCLILICLGAARVASPEPQVSRQARGQKLRRALRMTARVWAAVTVVGGVGVAVGYAAHIHDDIIVATVCAFTMTLLLLVRRYARALAGRVPGPPVHQARPRRLDWRATAVLVLLVIGTVLWRNVIWRQYALTLHFAPVRAGLFLAGVAFVLAYPVLAMADIYRLRRALRRAIEEHVDRESLFA